jgi:tripartite-type tricarboxylate transporter receptor subunit TctC
MRDVARAVPDGYTLTLRTVSTLAVAPALYKDPGFDPLISFAPVAAVSNEATVLVAAPHVTSHRLARRSGRPVLHRHVDVTPFIRAGKLKPLTIMSEERVRARAGTTWWRISGPAWSSPPARPPQLSVN